METIIVKVDKMCKECNFIDHPGSGYRIKLECDCGSLRWEKAYDKERGEGTQHTSQTLFRCTKCDSLQYAEKLH